MKMLNLFVIYILFLPVVTFAQKRDSIAMRGVIDTVDVIENRAYNAQDANAGSRVSRFLWKSCRLISQDHWQNCYPTIRLSILKV